MNISGIGIDIIDNDRIKKNLKNKSFIKRVFSKEEISTAKKLKNKISYYAKRYAAKEAFVKSIGTGFRKGLNFSDISIINDSLGKPSFVITIKIQKLLKKMFKTVSFNFLIIFESLL